jgi:hypothetical protein
MEGASRRLRADVSVRLARSKASLAMIVCQLALRPSGAATAFSGDRRDEPMDRKPPSLPMLSTLALLPTLSTEAKLPTLRTDAALPTLRTLVALSTDQKLR